MPVEAPVLRPLHSVPVAEPEAGGSRAWAERVIARYPAGSAVTVLHHPTEPGKSCFGAGFGVYGWVLAALAALLFLLALVA